MKCLLFRFISFLPLGFCLFAADNVADTNIESMKTMGDSISQETIIDVSLSNPSYNNKGSVMMSEDDMSSQSMQGTDDLPLMSPTQMLDSGDDSIAHDEAQDEDLPVYDDVPMMPKAKKAKKYLEISAVGMGVAPQDTISPAQALAMAKRAAIVDAYRQLGEKIYGVQVNSKETVKDLVLQNSTVKTRVEGLIKNAEVVETVYKDGLAQIVMELRFKKSFLTDIN